MRWFEVTETRGHIEDGKGDKHLVRFKRGSDYAAPNLKALLGDLGLKTFPLLSGGKGIHVVVPLDASRDWPTAGRSRGSTSRSRARCCGSSGWTGRRAST